MKSGKLETRDALAKAVGRSASTITSWLARPDWEFRRSPPWPVADVPAMLRWADNLQKNRAVPDEADDSPAPARPRVRFRDAMDPDHLFSLRWLIGATLMSECTTADVQQYVDVLNLAIDAAIEADGPNPSGETLVDALNQHMKVWILSRFEARAGWEELIEKETTWAT